MRLKSAGLARSLHSASEIGRLEGILSWDHTHSIIRKLLNNLILQHIS